MNDENQEPISKIVAPNDWQTFATQVSEFLKKKENFEWEKRFALYADKLNDEQRKILEKMRKAFHQWAPLYVYSSVSGAKNTKSSIKYDLRFQGMSIASIGVKGTDVSLALKNTTIEKYFDELYKAMPEIAEGNKTQWRGKIAKKIRGFFRKLANDRPLGKSEEHFLESKLLIEFSKRSSKEKSLINIQPVKLAGAYFQMPTPLSASGKEIKYSAENGGGIDILARVGRGRATRLCIMEVKDENTKGEPPAKVMRQALAYAVFIARLLRSNSGKDWYNLFGLKGNVPKELKIITAIVMPGTGMDFQEELKLEEINYTTTIMMRSLYLKESVNKGRLDFSGSLKEMLSKM